MKKKKKKGIIISYHYGGGEGGGSVSPRFLCYSDNGSMIIIGQCFVDMKSKVYILLLWTLGTSHYSSDGVDYSVVSMLLEKAGRCLILIFICGRTWFKRLTST